MIGLGIVALPAGLIASAFTQAREEEKQRKAEFARHAKMRAGR